MHGCCSAIRRPAFDDCEDLRNMESAKRELLLAGNSRGTVISRKEAVSDSEWRTVNVNNFAPRLFSSIGLPDPCLAVAPFQSRW